MSTEAEVVKIAGEFREYKAKAQEEIKALKDKNKLILDANGRTIQAVRKVIAETAEKYKKETGKLNDEIAKQKTVIDTYESCGLILWLYMAPFSRWIRKQYHIIVDRFRKEEVPFDPTTAQAELDVLIKNALDESKVVGRIEPPAVPIPQEKK